MYFEQKKGHSFFKQYAAQYIDGKYYIVYPDKFATHKHVYPNPGTIKIKDCRWRICRSLSS